jgi:hypothetical protein
VTDDIVTRLRIIHCAADDLTPCGTCLICQAADEIERLRAAGDELAEHLSNWAYSTEHALSEHRALETWEEVRRG